VALSTLTVTSSGDNVTQRGTLRYDVAHAQSGDTILVTAAVMNPIVLTHGELVLSQNVTITSVPAQTPTISGDGNSRIFEIAAGASVTLSDLNLIDGVANYDEGGAIRNRGTLTVSGSSFTSNSALEGGGLFNDGGATATVSGCRFTSNSGSNGGGGIYNNLQTITLSNGSTEIFFGTLTVSDSTFTSNSANDGGGLDNFGTASVSGSSFTSNSAIFGGGMDNASGATATVSNSAFTSNSASIDGGGIKNFGTLMQTGNIFTGNSPNDIS
jgi:hypothetical protein